MKRSANAEWNGSVVEGGGKIKLQSGTFEGNYSFNSRFGDDNKATNPEELIAAALAACYSMALTAAAGKAGFQPERINTNADVKIEKQGDAWVIPSIEIQTEAKIGGISEDEFQKLAEETKKTCPVSKVLAAAEISLKATLI